MADVRPVLLDGGNKVIIKITRTLKEKIEVSDKICKMYSMGKYNLADICKHYKVTVAGFFSWACPSLDVTAIIMRNGQLPKDCIPEVHHMYKETLKNLANLRNFNLVERSKQSLLSKVEGVPYQEVVVEEELDLDRHLDDGSDNPNFGKMKVVKRKTKTGRHQPDTTALIFTLTNLDSENFKNTNHNNVTVNTPDSGKGLEGLTTEELKAKKAEIKLKLLNSKSKIN